MRRVEELPRSVARNIWATAKAAPVHATELPLTVVERADYEQR